MPQYELNLRDYWRIIRKRRGIILFIVLALGLGSFVVTEIRRPVLNYMATATVKFERASTVTGLFMEVISWSPGDSIATQAEVIRSYPVIEGVAKEMGMIPKDVGEDIPFEDYQKLMEAGGDIAKDLEAIIKEKSDEYAKKSEEYLKIVSDIQSRIITKQIGNTSLIEISAKDKDPKKAQLLANTVANVYRDDNIRSRNRQVIEAKRFIENQLKIIEERLKVSEEALKDFRKKEGILPVPTETSSFIQSPLANTMDEYVKVKMALEETQQQVDSLKGKTILDSEKMIVSEDPASPMHKLYTQFIEQELARKSLLINYTKDHPLVKELDAKISNLKTEMGKELSKRLRSYRERLGILESQLKEFPDVAVRLSRLERETKINSDLFNLLKNKYQEVLIKGAEQIQEVTVIKPATLPKEPINRVDIGTNVLIGILFGLIFGLILAFVTEAFDTSIGTIEDVESFLGLPVLGIIPDVSEREAKKEIEKAYEPIADKVSLDFYYRFITHFSPKSVLAESYRSLRTNIQFASPDKELKTILITSASLSERKTSTVINLAVAFGQMGKKVLIIEADMRRPAIHQIFGLKKEPGLSEIIVQNTTLEEATRTFSDIVLGGFGLEEFLTAPGLDNLNIITSGSIPFNPSEILASVKMKGLIETVKSSYDVVIVDAPPVLPLTDTLILAPMIEGTILIYQVGRMARSALKRTKILLDNAQAKILGIVLTGVKAEISPDYYHHYYRYSEKPPKRKQMKEE
ncbi:MAG: AAA family ATPase [Nitrospirota bacterium]